MPGPHPRATGAASLLYGLPLSALGAVIGLQILTTLGITPNTSIIGVLVALALSRVPLPYSRALRSVHHQNLVQTSVSSATFGAANCLLLPIGVPLLIGRPDLTVPMLVGAAAAMFIDLAMLYWFFDSRLFPGAAPWPVGVATAEAILAGDEGGRRGALLGAGAAVGIAGASGGLGMVGGGLASAGLPMAAFGVAFIGNAWALTMFGLGLLLRGYGPTRLGVDVERLLVPHGVMIGAGAVALLQALAWAFGRSGREPAGRRQRAALTRSDRWLRLALGGGFVLYLGAAAMLALIGGLWAEMSAWRLAAWVAFAAAACIAAELIVGFSAMNAGWFPAFATALIFLVLALVLGFPAPATALLVGFVAAGAPAFADAGYDLKAGWYLRGHGADTGFELEGRRQQIHAAALGLVVGLVVVALYHGHYFRQDLFPPVARVYATAIRSAPDPAVAGQLLLWAVPGALVQLAGGARRQLGVLLGTGLLVVNPAAGWMVLAGVLLRLALTRGRGPGVEGPLTTAAAGCIAGDAIWTFGGAVAASGWR